MIALLGPLAARELSGSARRWQTYAVRLAYVSFVGAVVYRLWTSVAEGFHAVSVSDVADRARSLFAAFDPWQAILVTLGAAIAAADLLAREVRDGTLDLLILSPLSPRAVVFGKWKAAMAQACLLILAGTPVLAVCVFLGGAGWGELAGSVGLALAGAMLGSSVALFFSTLFRNGLVVVAVTVLSLAAHTALSFFAGRIPSTAARFIAAHLQPYLPFRAADGGWTIGSRALVTLLVCVEVTIVLLGWAARRVASRPRAAARHRFSTREAATFDRFRWGGRSSAGRISGRTRVWEADPLLWKELVTRPAGRVRYERRVLAGLVLLLVVGLTWPLLPPAPGGLFAWGAGFAFLAALNGVSLFAREREGRRWEVLFSTPLTAGRILRAKLLSGIVAPESVAALALVLFTVFISSTRLGPVGFALAAPVVCAFLALSYLLGSAASLFSRTTRGALFFSVAAVAVAAALPPFLRDLFGGAAGPAWGHPVFFLRELYGAGSRVFPRSLLVSCATCLLLHAAGAGVLLAALRWKLRRLAVPA